MFSIKTMTGLVGGLALMSGSAMAAETCTCDQPQQQTPATTISVHPGQGQDLAIAVPNTPVETPYALTGRNDQQVRVVHVRTGQGEAIVVMPVR